MGRGYINPPFPCTMVGCDFACSPRVKPRVTSSTVTSFQSLSRGTLVLLWYCLLTICCKIWFKHLSLWIEIKARALRLSLRWSKSHRIHHESGDFWHRIRFCVYTQRDESGAKNHRIHHESEHFECNQRSRYFESEYFQIRNLSLCKWFFLVNPKTFYSFYGLRVLISYILLASFSRCKN